MLIGQEVFGDVTLGGDIQGTPIFPPVSFGENSCVRISEQVEILSIAKVCEGSE